MWEGCSKANFIEYSMVEPVDMAPYFGFTKEVIHRELATGKGFADLVLIPRKNVDSPAIVIELKYDKVGVTTSISARDSMSLMSHS